MFWKKGSNGGTNLSGPKGIPDLVGRHMVVEMNKNPDLVWGLKTVSREVAKKQYYCRVYDETETAKANVKVKDWTSLDGHPELVLWEGFVDGKGMLVRVEKFVPASDPGAAR